MNKKPTASTTISEGTVVHNTFTITAKEMDMFEQLSGDRNPIHHDIAFTKAHHLQGPVVYGGLLVSQISRLLGMQLPGSGWMWHSLSIQFKNPLYLNERVDLTGRVTYLNQDLGIIRLQIEMKRGKILIAEAEAQAGQLKK
jgi:acyl dehydratase